MHCSGAEAAAASAAGSVAGNASAAAELSETLWLLGLPWTLRLASPPTMPDVAASWRERERERERERGERESTLQTSRAAIIIIFAWSNSECSDVHLAITQLQELQEQHL